MNTSRGHLRVRGGQDVQASHVRDIDALIQERTYLPGYNVRRREVPGYGVFFEAEEQVANWDHMWETSLVGSAATVAAGTLNTDIPWLDDGKGLRPMDGLDADSEADSRGVPVLKLAPEMFDEDGYSWIVLRVFVDGATGARLKPADGGLTLAQTALNTWQNGASLDQELDGRHFGDWPLVTLRRPRAETTGFGTLTQFAMFPLNHRFVATQKEGGKSVHFFWV